MSFLVALHYTCWHVQIPSRLDASLMNSESLSYDVQIMYGVVVTIDHWRDARRAAGLKGSHISHQRYAISYIRDLLSLMTEINKPLAEDSEASLVDGDMPAASVCQTVSLLAAATTRVVSTISCGCVDNAELQRMRDVS